MDNTSLTAKIVAELFLQGLIDVTDLKSAKALIGKILDEEENEPV